MNTILRYILVLLGFLFISDANAQRAKDGSYTVTGAAEVLNTYTNLTVNATAGATSISVANNAMTGGAFGGTPLQQGDLILIVQMHGATVDVNFFPVVAGWGSYTWPQSYFDSGFGTTPETFGQVTNYNNSGRYERVEVLSTSGGGTINLTCGLTYNYTAADEVQIVRIPRLDDLTVNGGAAVVPDIWDGTTGGVVALEVDGTLTLSAGGTITASGYGFRGGQLDTDFVPGAANTGGQGSDRFLGSPSGFEGSEKGESIGGYHVEYDLIYSRYGVSGIANGGGGGGFVNSGGGGGSNAEVGAGAFNGRGNPVAGYAAAYGQDPTITASSGAGQGGYSLSQSNQNAGFTGPNQAAWSGDGRKNAGGWGGHPLAYDAGRIFFGGGGGAGDQDSGEGGDGGRGGGIVYIVNYGTVTGSGGIQANGGAGENSNPLNLPLGFNAYRGNDGAGGGGGAGTVYIENAAAIPGTVSIDAIGGDGGDQNLQVNAFQANEAGGPGGAGSGGIVRYSSGTPTTSVISGNAGTTTSTQLSEFPPNGATNGSAGDTLTTAPYYDLIPNDVTICAGQMASPSVTVNGSYTGTLNWYTVQYGGSPIAGQTNQLSYNVSPGTTTTYWVGVCPGTFRVPVVVTVLASPNLVITDPAAVCAPATVDITLPAVTAGSDVGTLTYWQDNGATISQLTPTSVGGGWHYIQLDVGGGCTALDSVFVTINPLDDASFSYSSATYCSDAADPTPTVTGLGGGTFSSTPGLSINTSTGQIDVSASTPGAYTVTYTTSGPCPNSSNQSVTIYAAPTISGPTSVCPGATIALTGTGTPDGTTPWTSSNTSAATVDNLGNVTGFAVGATTITYLDANGCSNTYVVNVSAAPVLDPVANVTGCDSIQLATITGTGLTGNEAYYSGTGGTGTMFTAGDWISSSMTMYVNDLSNPCTVEQSFTITINVSPTISGPTSVCPGATIALSGTGTPDGTTPWTSSNTSAATVDNLGNVTGVAVGATTITYLDANGCSNTYVVNVSAAPVLDPVANITGCDSIQLATITGTALTGNEAYYSGTGGTGTMYTAGDWISSSMTMYVNDLSNPCTVEQSFTITINVSPTISGPTSVCPGATIALSGTGTPDGTTPWTSSNTSAATVDNLGNVTGVAVGTTTITYLDANGCSDTYVINVSSAPVLDPVANITGCDSIQLAPITGTGLTGNEAYYSGMGGTGTMYTAGDWISSSMTMYVNDLSNPCTVEQSFTITINVSPTISGPTSVCPGATIALSGTGTPDGTTPWASSNTGVATVDNLGNVTGVVPGGTTITYLDANGCSGTYAVTVIAAPDITPIPNLSDCDSIQLPAIAGTNLSGSQAYYDGMGGTGTIYTAGQWISSSITLYAYDISGGCFDEETFNVVIETIPTAAFTANPVTGCVIPQVVFFTDNSTLPDTWFWDFGNGNTSALQNPVHSYTSFGVFTVTLTVTDTINGCSDQATTTITVTSPPVLDPQANISGCDSIQLPVITGTGLTGNEAYYSGTGGTGTQYAAGDWITASMTMYINDLSNPCTAEQSFAISVNPSPTISGPTSVCAGASIALVGTGTPDGTTPWTSSNTGVATVDNLGNVTGVSAGSTTIIYLDNNGCSDTYTVSVIATPILDPMANVTACDSVQLATITGTGLTGNESYYSGTGGTGTVYSASDWISSSMTMYINDLSNACTAEQSFNITINVSPTVSGPTSVCPGATAGLTGTGTPDGTTPWTSSNTGVATVDNAGNVTGIAAGTSDITYTDINGCSNTVTITVNATPTISGNAPICVAATNTLTGSGTPDATTPWTSSDPSVATIDNAGVVAAVAAGTTTITYLDANGCSTTEVVTVNAAPNLVITDPVAVCDPLTVDITDPAVTAGSDPGTLTYWTDNLATITLATPNAVNTTNTYYIQLDDGNCTAIQPVNVTVNPAPTIALTDPAPVCDPALVDLTDAAVTTGSDPGTFTYFDGMGTAVPTPTAVGSGMYFITLTDGNGCQSAGQVTATVNPTPNLVVTDPSPVCEPNTVDLNAAIVTAGSDPGTLTYWIDAGATATLSTPTGVLTGMYYIQLEDGNGCSSIASVNATVDPLDDASFFLNPTCDGATATLTGTAGGTFSLLTATSATIDPTTGTVTGASYNEALDIEYATTGICPNNSVELVIVDDCTPEELIIPTAFTPGSDGAHDTWEIVGLDNVYPNSRVTVYNRWGNKVFEHNASSSDPYNNNMWDGTFNGAQLPAASYYYIIETNDASSTEKYEGTVTILQ